MRKGLKFIDDEKVLCYHGLLIYEAKVLKGELWEESEEHQAGPHYFVHYKGWKPKWDEWVPEERILKYSEENLRIQHEVKEKNGTEEADKKRKDRKVDPRKRSRESGNNDEELAKMPEIKLPIPDSLKLKLVDEWENITKNSKLLTLPADKSVNEISDEFLHYMLSKDVPEDEVKEFVEGLKLYFQEALGLLLLYRFEKYQHLEILRENPGKTNSDLYGAEHLLRLFGKPFI